MGEEEALAFLRHTCATRASSPPFSSPASPPRVFLRLSPFTMGLLSILKKLKEKEKEVRLLML